MYILLLFALSSAGECPFNHPQQMVDGLDNIINFYVKEDAQGKCVPHGEWRELYPDGKQIRLIGYYKYGKECGTWTYFRKNGNPMTKGSYDCSTGNEKGIWKYWFENGKLFQEGTYCDGKQCGEWKQYWDTGGIRAITNWKVGRMNGPIVNYFPNGKMAVSGQMFYGKKVGQWTWWDREGKIINQENFDKK